VRSNFASISGSGRRGRHVDFGASVDFEVHMMRRALKPELRNEAIKREESLLKVTPWKDGKPVKAAQ
uniref:ATP synthase subunit epsilon n=2 Tax=Artemia franciscana TaxID=6661 RepID=A0AC62AED4_ARTSF